MFSYIQPQAKSYRSKISPFRCSLVEMTMIFTFKSVIDNGVEGLLFAICKKSSTTLRLKTAVLI
jgi:hypothetical protein